MKKLRFLIIPILLNTLLKLFGCSGQPNKQNENVKKDTLTEQINRSIDAFMNRQIHKVLTVQIIDTTSDEELVLKVLDNLSEKLPTDYTKEYQTVLSWTKPRQAIYIIWQLEAEVNNGGYNQFYANSSGQFYKLLPEALKLVGANKFADLTERANRTYEAENEKIKKHQDGTIEGFSKSYKNNPLNKFDDEFYTLEKSENLQQLQVDFIRKHKNEFIDK